MSDNKKLPITFRVMTKSEHIYSFAQSHQLNMQCGFIGYLRGDFGKSGNEFWTTWFESNSSLKTSEFSTELDNVINSLKDDISYKGVLSNFEDMKMLCTARQNAFISEYPDSRSYGFRVDTNKNAYLIRCIPYKSDYNFYVYAYDRASLNRHIANAEKGIRFITPAYKELFRLKDGGKIKVIYSNGDTDIKACRFIDEYHTQIDNNIYHICEYAERCQRAGTTVVQADNSYLMQNPHRHNSEPER